VTADDLVDRRLECGEIERAFDANGSRDVVGRVAGIEAIDQPQPPLRERQRKDIDIVFAAGG